MRQPLHFISGLPRSGSTLLAAILRQNPAFHAAMSSPLYQIVMAALGAMGPKNDYHSFIEDHQRNDIATAVVEAFYRKQSSLRGQSDVVVVPKSVRRRQSAALCPRSRDRG